MIRCLRRKRFAGLAAITVLMTLLGCGGGGGDDDTPPPDNGDIEEPDPPPPDNGDIGEPDPPDDITLLLSGTIDIAAGVAVDNDVNDPLGQNGPANDPGNPFVAPGTEYGQEIPNPVLLGGYANVAGFGPIGQFTVTGDPDDYFRGGFKAGQIVTLNIADVAFGDLDLLLWDSGGQEILDASRGLGTTETLIIPADGAYVLNVFAYAGASNYTLTVGQDTSASPGGAFRLSDEFVPGEAIVKLRKVALSAASSSGDKMAQARAIAAVSGYSIQQGTPERNMLWRLDPTQAAPLQFAGAKSDPLLQKVQFVSPGLRDKWETLAAIKALRARDEVDIAEPNFIRHPFLEPDDPGYDLQWHYPLINLPQAWDLTTGATSGDDVVVAVVDTGVLLAHPDLEGQLVDGYDFISDPVNAADGNGIDSNPDDPGDGFLGASSFHGTHVAGTVAAATDNDTGVAGIAWNAKIMPLRVLGITGGSTFDIQQAVLYAAGLPNDSGTVPDPPADIINLSLGGPGFSATDQAVFNEVRDRGVMVIAAAGNENTSAPSYPAAYDGVVSVSAVGPDKSRAFYSNFGNTIDVAAPGGDMRFDHDGDGFADGVLSTGGDDSGGAIEFIYPFQQGTSMASPHVAGVAALMEAVAQNDGGNLTPDQFDALLAGGLITEDVGVAGRDDEFGHGLIDAAKAVSEVGNNVSTEPLLSVSPQALNFSTSLTSATLTVANVGGGELVVNSVEPSESWVTVAAGNDVNQYQVVVNRSGLADGVYAAAVTFDSNGGARNIPVIMQVGGVAPSTNAGFHYVLLIDADEPDPTLEVKAQFNVGAVDSIYEYFFDNVDPALNYIIVAGTDFDNDGFICDGGEACGAYITLDQPIRLENLTDDVADLDFTTGFLTQITQLSAEGMGRADGFKLLRNKTNTDVQEFKHVD